MNVALWVAQVLLAITFGSAGYLKATAPESFWPGAVPATLVRFIGLSELAGALGVLLPAAARIFPWLTPLAAAGLVMIMVLASAFHLSRGETQALSLTLGLGGLAAFVAWGRFRKAPIAAGS
ncbi:MAG: DoxX family protein [Acidobacteria bacterium]|nr:DoxX family protein [Acidobacteriota bacterium]